MKRILSLCVYAFLAITSFSQVSIEMQKEVADNGEPYFQGELSLNDFIPTLNTAYIVDFKNLTTNTQIGKIQVNIVDRSETNGWWVEVNPVYKVLGEDVTPDDAITTEAKIFVKQLGETPEEGKYAMVFHA